jgi:DNA-binding transcriptional MerR regulator
MDPNLTDLLQLAEIEHSGWDDEFYVSIGKAAKLSGLSQSQIRYFEKSLEGITIGKREGPNKRNRVYTKRDIRLLKWVYQCSNIRTADMSQLIKDNQNEIFESLGQSTLPQIIQYEQTIMGRDALISGLVTILLSIWQESSKPSGKYIQGIILGPPDEDWRKSLQETIENNSSINLENSLVIWLTNAAKESVDDPIILFSRQSWYLPPLEGLQYITDWLPDPRNAFSIAVIWRKPDSEELSKEQEQPFTIELDEPRQLLTRMLMSALEASLKSVSITQGEPVSIFSRSTLGRTAVLRGLSLLLECCIVPYFPDCYTYIAEFSKEEQLQVLQQAGDITAGYTPQLLDRFQTVEAHRFPWWIKFAKDQAGIALDKDASRRPESLNEHGSVVCFPLIGQDKVVGVLCLENSHIATDIHCLAPRQGIDGPGLLRFLNCIAEIAAHYLVHSTSSFERAEKSRLAYTRYETTMWHWNIYQQGGLNYTTIIERILDWTSQIAIGSEGSVDIAIIDIAKEGELAKQYKGFDIIIDLVQKTRARIQTAIQNDSAAKVYASKQQLVLFEDPVTDHLILVTANVERDYLLVFLERIRRYWQAVTDPFIWQGETAPVSMQIGICTFPNLGAYKRAVAAEMMKHHFWELSNMMIYNPLLENILEYFPTVVTSKVTD